MSSIDFSTSSCVFSFLSNFSIFFSLSYSSSSLSLSNLLPWLKRHGCRNCRTNYWFIRGMPLSPTGKRCHFSSHFSWFDGEFDFIPSAAMGLLMNPLFPLLTNSCIFTGNQLHLRVPSTTCRGLSIIQSVIAFHFLLPLSARDKGIINHSWVAYGFDNVPVNQSSIVIFRRLHLELVLVRYFTYSL